MHLIENSNFSYLSEQARFMAPAIHTFVCAYTRVNQLNAYYKTDYKVYCRQSQVHKTLQFGFCSSPVISFTASVSYKNLASL